MSFFKKVFGTNKGDEKKIPKKVKSIKEKREKENNKSGRGGQNEFLNKLNIVIKEAKEMVSKSPKIGIVRETAINIVEGFFYANIINNFKNNLTEENKKELNITDKEVKTIEKVFNDIFRQCNLNIESCSNEGGINYKKYQNFKKQLKKVSKNSYKLLIELEKHIDFETCEDNINKFKKDIKNLGKELKIGKIKRKDGSLGISIDFESDDDHDSTDDNYLDEITNFNNFEINLEDYYEEDVNFTHKTITLEDDKGHFHGEYNISNNKKFIVAFDDGYIRENNEHVGGQVYLIKDKRKILWKKRLERPNAAFVTNDGIVIVIDWTFSSELTGKIIFFDVKGKKLFEYSFNSNIGGQDISKDGTELIITTCFPENALYLFSIKERRLLKKVENNTRQRPLVDFNFSEVKSYILRSPEFNQQAYDLQRQQEEKDIQEEKKRIESLKKRKVSDLSYEEIVELGSIYVGDFYENFGQPRIALKYLLRALEMRKEKPQPYVLKLLGFCYEKLKDYKNAIKYYKWSLDRYPPYKNSVVVDHLEFCQLKLNKKIEEDWTSFIIKKKKEIIYEL